MRAIVTIFAIVVIVAIVAVYTGFINLSGSAGSMPKVAIEGGKAPTIDASVGSVDFGTKNTTVEVPKVETTTTTKTVEVPTFAVKKAQ